MLSKRSCQLLCVFVSVVTVPNVGSEYVGHPLITGRRTENNAKSLYIDYALELINGTVTSFFFHTSTLEEDLAPYPIRMQFWLTQATRNKLITFKLVFEKRMIINRSMLDKQVKVPVWPGFEVTPEHKLGFTNEGSYCVVNLHLDNHDQTTYLQKIINFPELEDNVTIPTGRRHPITFSMGVEIVKDPSLYTLASATAETVKPPASTVGGASRTSLIHAFLQFLCFASVLLIYMDIYGWREWFAI